MFKLVSLVGPLAAASALCLSASASPLQFLPPLLATDVNLGTIQLGARVLVGDQVCPAISGNGINARVFAAVSLKERANVDAHINGIVNVNLKAALEATVQVCLCVQASVASDLVDIPASVNAEALADLKLAGQLTGNVNLGLALQALGADIDLSLSPLSSSPCTCPANARPTCAGGQCGCEQCPADHIYDPTTGGCIVTCPVTSYPHCTSPTHCQCLPCPSGAEFDAHLGLCVCAPGSVINTHGTACIPVPSGLPAHDDRKKRSYVKLPEYGKRQATREDIVKRLQLA